MPSRCACLPASDGRIPIVDCHRLPDCQSEIGPLKDHNKVLRALAGEKKDFEMKVAILAGGLGTRLSEETSIRPKPMAEVCGEAVEWGIMKIYSYHGFNDFVVLGGYKVEFIRDYFLRYQSMTNDFTIDLATGKVNW